MGKVITIVSGKGGVGKTTSAASLGAALSRTGKKVLLIDGDIGLRNLDIALGLENDVVYDLYDVIQKVVQPEEAVLAHERYEQLFLLPAPQNRTPDEIETADFLAMCACFRPQYDYILVDAPAGIDRGFKNAVSGADTAIVVVSPDLSSVRDGEKVLSILENTYHIGSCRVLITRYNPEMVRLQSMLSIEDLVSLLKERLIGVIPEDLRLLRAANVGEGQLLLPDSLAFAAYANTARRLEGETVPLLKIKPKHTTLGAMKKWLRQRKNSVH